MAALSEKSFLAPQIGEAVGVYTMKFYGVTSNFPDVKSQSRIIFTFFFSPQISYQFKYRNSK